MVRYNCSTYKEIVCDLDVLENRHRLKAEKHLNTLPQPLGRL